MSVGNVSNAATARFASIPAPSPLPGVSDEKWEAYERAMSTRPIGKSSAGGAIGSFGLSPRRLGEIGVMTNPHRIGSVWVGDPTPPYAALARSATLQRAVFALTTRLYDEDLRAGRIVQPEGVSRSGALAILHCGGKTALEGWPANAFRTTRDIVARANGLF